MAQLYKEQGEYDKAIDALHEANKYDSTVDAKFLQPLLKEVGK